MGHKAIFAPQFVPLWLAPAGRWLVNLVCSCCVQLRGCLPIYADPTPARPCHQMDNPCHQLLPAVQYQLP